MKTFIIIVVLLFVASHAIAGNTGKQELNDGKGTVVCYYTDFNTGHQYSKTALYVCPSQ